MPSRVTTRRPLPARVYWTRRLVVLGAPLLLVIVLARVLGGSSDGKDPETGGAATQAGATIKESGQSAAAGADAAEKRPAKRGKKGKRGKRNRALPVGPVAPLTPVVPVEPVPAEPTGPCSEADIMVVPAITSAPGGAAIPITLNLRTLSAPACTWHVSSETLAVTITSGSDHIWSSRECPNAIPEQDVVVRSALDAPVVLTWSAQRSDETCSDRSGWADLGFYHVEAAALGGEATDVQFELVAPVAPVITKTAEPEQQGSKGGKGGKKNRDKSHQPGQDGAGNSEG